MAEIAALHDVVPALKSVLGDLTAEEQTALAETLSSKPDVAPELSFFTLQDLAASASRQRTTWLIRGWWCHPSYGMAAGPEKTLKSWVDAIENVAIASGEKFLDAFEVVTPGPVVIFSGEISATLYWRRLRHIARSMGLTDAVFQRLPITITSQRAPLMSDIFQRSLRGQLDKEPVKISLDPLYSYHGHDVEASNVYASGHVLNHFSEPVMEAGVSGKITNHFRKGVSGALSLEDITQAGGREWVDSWHLIKQREKAKMGAEANDFFLHTEIGSRQWGARSYDIDISLGGFDEETFEYTGAMSWSVIEAEDKSSVPGEAKRLETLAILDARDGSSMTAPELADDLGVPINTARDRLNALVHRGLASKDDKVKPHVYKSLTEMLGILNGGKDATHWPD